MPKMQMPGDENESSIKHQHKPPLPQKCFLLCLSIVFILFKLRKNKHQKRIRKIGIPEQCRYSSFHSFREIFAKKGKEKTGSAFSVKDVWFHPHHGRHTTTIDTNEQRAKNSFHKKELKTEEDQTKKRTDHNNNGWAIAPANTMTMMFVIFISIWNCNVIWEIDKK